MGCTEHFGDKEWAKLIYNKTENICNNRDDYEKLISQVQKQTADNDLLSQIHNSAENKFKEARDFIYLAESISKAEQASDADKYMFELLATSIANKLDDRKWASLVLNKWLRAQH